MLEYSKLAREVAYEIEEVILAELLPSLRGEFRSDALTDTLRRAISSIADRAGRIIDSQKLRSAIERIAGRINGHTSRDLSRVIGIEIPASVARHRLPAWIEANVDLIRKATLEQTQVITSILDESIRIGRTHRQVADIIRERTDVMASRIEQIARDQVLTLNAQLNQEKQQSAGVSRYEWSTSNDERVRGHHGDLDGEIFSWDDPPLGGGTHEDETGHPGEGINCFPGWSKINFAGDVKRAFRHWYSGKMSLFVTDTGETLYATPNHPMLTSAGWKPAQLIKEGDNLIHVRYESRKHTRENQNNSVSSIAEIFESLSVDGIRGTAGLGSANFHGDIPESNVDIITAARGLGVDDYAGSVQRGDKLSFPKTNDATPRLSSFAQFFIRSFLSSHGIVGFLGKIFTLGWRHLCHAYYVCFRACARACSGFFQNPPDYVSSHASSFGNRQLALAGAVSSNDRKRIKSNLVGNGHVGTGIEAPLTKPFADQIGIDSDIPGDFLDGKTIAKELRRVVYAGSIEFSGHVYNLETGKGWYVTEGVVSHNCRCVSIPILDELVISGQQDVS